jgi:hypothetical protein
MKRKRTGVPLLVLTGLVLLLWLVPAQSDLAAPDRNDFPLPFDAATLHQDLSSWLSGQDVAPQRTISEADLERALTDRDGDSLDLFVRSDVSAVHEVLFGIPYGSTLISVCERNHVDPLLIAAVVEVESQFTADAVSPEGAVGLMQLLPSTGRLYGIRDLSDPVANLEAGSRYFGELQSRFGGDEELALAAYNTGPEVIARYHGIPPYRETRGFVRKVLALYHRHQDSAHTLASNRDSVFAHRLLPRVKGAA